MFIGCVAHRENLNSVRVNCQREGRQCILIFYISINRTIQLWDIGLASQCLQSCCYGKRRDFLGDPTCGVSLILSFLHAQISCCDIDCDGINTGY
jgi:hypothetical protein